MICLTAGWAWLVTVLVAGSTFTATIVVDGWTEDRGILFGTLVAGLAIWGISQSINRNIEVLAVREENVQGVIQEIRKKLQTLQQVQPTPRPAKGDNP